jgi:pimeloyl-ACP methyl ester carboxylesterase
VVLFCHGGSLHKRVWSPIIQRLQASPLLQRVACEFVAFDWRYHGTNACDEELATLFYEGNDPRSPRVLHPANCWPQWAPEQLVEMLSELKGDDDKLGRATKIIGVGHSMGGANLLQFEVLYPGSFEGLVLLEPTLSFECKTFGGAKWAMDMLVKATLAREDKWCEKVWGESTQGE